MTQIVGIVCKDGIVIASESQYTTGTRKLLHGVKLSTIKFKNSTILGGVFDGALIAEAGNEAFSSLAVGYINEQAKDTAINGIHSVAEIVETAVNRIRREILSSMQERPYSIAEQDEIFGPYSKPYFQLMFGHYYFPPKESGERPVARLYTISLDSAKASPKFPFAMIGSAPELALFMLKQFPCEQLLWGEASCLAIDVLQRINNDDIYCGGPIKLGTVWSVIGTQSLAAIYGDDLVSRVLKKLEALRKKTSSREKKELGAVMKKIHHENFKEGMKRVKAEEEEENKLRQWARIHHPVTGKVGPSAVREIDPENKDKN
jgi:hypothetical protein